ncbi:hypothetical protein D8S78_23635 [Natrialba swarupiae]|nr:hypothetical protein [Natrialba swarupiae]
MPWGIDRGLVRRTVSCHYQSFALRACNVTGYRGPLSLEGRCSSKSGIERRRDQRNGRSSPRSSETD